MTSAPPPAFGVVVIGRNEGERLKRCIESVLGRAERVVYVDSGSTDGSVAWARARGVEVVVLDSTLAFTAARARNRGFQRLCELLPGVPLVQFVDGDCEVMPGWLEAARDFLARHADVAVVCGRRRERFPERSVYNRLCDMEWNTPVGEARACGGDAMMRCAALLAVGGFRDTLIAGEEPELCVRLRRAGWRIWRLPQEMTLHDAALTRLGQWWRRSQRAGHAYAEGAWLHGAPPERHNAVPLRRALLWGLVLPVLALVLCGVAWPVGLLAWALYPLQVLRLGWRQRALGRDGWWQACFWVLARLPEAQGVLTFWLNRWRRRRSALIEYK